MDIHGVCYHEIMNLHLNGAGFLFWEDHMELLYHGSFSSDIRRLNATSKNHDKAEEKVVYMTTNRAYALFYIWDAERNKSKNKWITAWIKNGITGYHEQFPGQFKSFYNNVSGFIYYCSKKEDWVKASKPDTWMCNHDVTLEGYEKVENVYEEILKYEAEGKVHIIRFETMTPEEQDQTVQMIADFIINRNYLLNPHEEEALFLKSYNKLAWERAEKMLK